MAAAVAVTAATAGVLAGMVTVEVWGRAVEEAEAWAMVAVAVMEMASWVAAMVVAEAVKDAVVAVVAGSEAGVEVAVVAVGVAVVAAAVAVVEGAQVRAEYQME